jgi:hypothetical protein
MNYRPALFPGTIILMAALSFAAGRLLPKSSEVSAPITEKSLPDDGAIEAKAQISVPAHLPDVVAMPFPETYAVLKSASIEQLRAYFNELEQKQPKPTRHAALVAFFKTLIHVNPALTRELIVGLKKDDRWPAMFAIRDAAPPSGMQAVAEVLLSFNRMEISSCSWDMLRENLDEWGKNDPLALKQFLESHRDQNVERCFDKLVRNWAAYDPEAAQRWMTEEVQRHPPPPEGDENWGDGWTAEMSEMAVAWVEGFLENDPDAAVKYVLEHATEPSVSDAINPFAGDLFIMSPDRARDFVKSLPEKQRSESLAGIASKADRFVESEAGDGTTSPRFVAEWMQRSFPDSWEEHIEYVLREWKYGNAQELLAWMAALPAGARGAVVRRFPTYVSDEKPNEDFDLIMQIHDTVVRDALLESLAREATSNGKALLGVLDKSDLPASQKVHLVSLVPADNSVTASDEN